MAIDWIRIGIGAFAAVSATSFAYYGQPLIHDNSQAINVLVIVFSILAGFLVAIITIIGDPMLLPPGTWRAAEMERERLVKRLVRHKWLFTLYLITLALIFLTLLLQTRYPQITLWLERGYLLCGTFAFILSMRLPSMLMKIQQDRIDAMIEYKRKCDNIHS